MRSATRRRGGSTSPRSIIHLAGQVAIAPDGTPLADADFDTQARQVFRNLRGGAPAGRARLRGHRQGHRLPDRHLATCRTTGASRPSSSPAASRPRPRSRSRASRSRAHDRGRGDRGSLARCRGAPVSRATCRLSVARRSHPRVARRYRRQPVRHSVFRPSHGTPRPGAATHICRPDRRRAFPALGRRAGSRRHRDGRPLLPDLPPRAVHGGAAGARPRALPALRDSLAHRQSAPAPPSTCWRRALGRQRAATSSRSTGRPSPHDRRRGRRPGEAPERRSRERAHRDVERLAARLRAELLFGDLHGLRPAVRLDRSAPCVGFRRRSRRTGAEGDLVRGDSPSLADRDRPARKAPHADRAR